MSCASFFFFGFDSCGCVCGHLCLHFCLSLSSSSFKGFLMQMAGAVSFVALRMLMLVALLLIAVEGSTDATTPPPVLLWSAKSGLCAEDGVVVDSGVAYSNGGPTMTAFNAANGTILWQVNLPCDPCAQSGKSTPVLHNGILYFGSNRHFLALSADDGAVLWSLNTAAVESSPLLVPSTGTLYFGDSLGTLRAVTANGTVKWATNLGGEIYYHRPSIDGGLVVCGAGQSLYGVQMDTGNVAWSVASSALVQSTPLIHDGVVYSGGNVGEFFAVHSQSGKVLWRVSTPAIAAGAAFVNGLVVAATYQLPYQLIAFDPKSGKEVFTVPLDGPVGGGMVNGVEDNNQVLVSNFNGVTSVNLDSRNVTWEWHTPAAEMNVYMFLPPTDGVLYVSDSQGMVYALQLHKNKTIAKALRCTDSNCLINCSPITTVQLGCIVRNTTSVRRECGNGSINGSRALVVTRYDNGGEASCIGMCTTTVYDVGHCYVDPIGSFMVTSCPP